MKEVDMVSLNKRSDEFMNSYIQTNSYISKQNTSL